MSLIIKENPATELVVVPPDLRFASSGEFAVEPAEEQEHCWLFVEPLSGHWVCFAGLPLRLAVFRDQGHARHKERYSFVLQRCIAHEVEFGEMKAIAQRVCAGLWGWV